MKTHFPFLSLLSDYDLTETSTRVVFLVRNPYDAIITSRSRFVRSREAPYWNDTHTTPLLKPGYFGEHVGNFLYQMCVNVEALIHIHTCDKE